MTDLSQSAAPLRRPFARIDKVLLTCVGIAIALLLLDRAAFWPSITEAATSLAQTGPFILFAVAAIGVMRATGSERLMEGAFEGRETRRHGLLAGLAPDGSRHVRDHGGRARHRLRHCQDHRRRRDRPDGRFCHDGPLRHGIAGQSAEGADAVRLRLLLRRRGGQADPEMGLLAGRAAPILLGALLGAPAYLNGYAAVPLIEGLVAQGMSQGAAMSFVIAGGVSSIPAAVAVWALVKPKIFLSYLGLAITGAILAGLTWGAIA